MPRGPRLQGVLSAGALSFFLLFSAFFSLLSVIFRESWVMPCLSNRRSLSSSRLLIFSYAVRYVFFILSTSLIKLFFHRAYTQEHKVLTLYSCNNRADLCWTEKENLIQCWWMCVNFICIKKSFSFFFSRSGIEDDSSSLMQQKLEKQVGSQTASICCSLIKCLTHMPRFYVKN